MTASAKSGSDTGPSAGGAARLVVASQEGRANARAAAGRDRGRLERDPRRGLLAETGRWVATRSAFEGAWYRWPWTTGATSGPTGVGSAARTDSAPGKGGKVSRVASALPHSEGGADTRGGLVKGHRACETGGWGRSTLRWTETTELGPEPRTPGVSGASREEGPSGLPFGARHRSTVDRVVGRCAQAEANRTPAGVCGESA